MKIKHKKQNKKVELTNLELGQLFRIPNDHGDLDNEPTEQNVYMKVAIENDFNSVTVLDLQTGIVSSRLGNPNVIPVDGELVADF